MMKPCGFAITLLASSLIAACAPAGGSGGSSNDAQGGNISFKTEPVSGLIDGAAWVVASGRARTDIFDASKISVELWDRAVQNPCDDFASVERRILFSLPAQVGNYVLSNRQTFTIYTFSNGMNVNRAVTRGSIVLTELDANGLAGMIAGEFDQLNGVNGTFRIVRCP